jgi:glyoxylase-like metal-dependent hydrolase (beta-lactamase superfamily II)
MVDSNSEVPLQRISDDLSLIDLRPPIPGFDEFLGCYILRGEKIALIDVGPSNCVENLLRGLETLSIAPEEIGYILATHVHIDHAGGLGHLVERMPRAKIVVHERGRAHVVDPAKLWEGSKATLGEVAVKYGEIAPVPENRIVVAEEGMEIDLGRGTLLRVLLTPGHASHHLCLIEKRDGFLFAGEAAGISAQGAMRPASPPPFNLDQAVASVDKLIAATPSVLCYGHFGYVTEAGEKLQLHREQLVVWGEAIADCLAKGAGMDEMTQELGKRDRLLEELDKLPEGQRNRERFFLGNSIAGFVGYFSKFGIPKGDS